MSILVYVQFLFVVVLVSTVVPLIKGTNVCGLSDNDTVLLSGSCNFNNGECGYGFPDTVWGIHTEKYGSLIYGQVRGDYEGDAQTFALFQSNDPSLNDTTIKNTSISTTEITSSPVCLKFWYLMPNQNSKLEVYMVPSNGNTPMLLFEHKYSAISQWQEVKLSVTSSSAFKIEFQSERENSYGYVGVDNVLFLAERPPPTTTTTTISTTTTTAIPTTRFTTVETTSDDTTTIQQNIITTQTPYRDPTTAEATIATTDNTKDETTASQTTEREEPSTETPFIETTETTRNMTSEAPEHTTTDCVCQCPTVKTICAGSLNKVTTPDPVRTVCDLASERLSVLDQYSCNFDHDICGYTLTDYPHLWERTSHRYGDVSVGEIIGDHSKESLGGYVVFNTYNNHVQNNTLHNFRSPSLLPFTQYCASFWYNMPNNASELQVFAEFQNGTRLLLWKMSGSATSGWVPAKIPLLEDSVFMLVFSSIKKNSASFVAIDDIRISIEKPRITLPTGRKRRSLRHLSRSAQSADDTSGCSCTCPPYHVIDCHTTPKPIPPQEPSCRDLINTVYVDEGSCNFDRGTSCYYDMPIYPHLWDLVRYSYGNKTLGLINGDTSKDGNGLFLTFMTDDFHVQFGMTSHFRSVTLTEVGKLCLSFWYNLPSDSAAVSLYKQVGDKRELLWKKDQQTTSGWQKETILFQGEPNMKIDFTATKSSLNGYFGIDDIQLYGNVTV